VDDRPHVRLVDAHPERVRRADDPHVVGQEAPLHDGAVLATQPGVVGDRLLAEGGREVRRDLLGARARARVDDRRQRVAGPERAGEQRPLLVTAGARHGEADVRPVEARGHAQRVAQRQPPHDVARHTRRCRGRRRDDRRGPEHPCRVGEPEVVRAEVVAPLRDAVRLVHDEQAHVRRAHPVEEPDGGEALGRDVEQLQLTRGGAIDRIRVRVAALLRIHERHAPAEPARGERLHLILHQRDKRRDDHCEVVPEQGGELVAERLPRPRRHHDHHVAVGERRLARLALPRPEAGEAEVLL
jgi:hypothetical protein